MEFGTDNEADNKNQATPLHIAFLNCFLPIVQYLIENNKKSGIIPFLGQHLHLEVQERILSQF